MVSRFPFRFKTAASVRADGKDTPCVRVFFKDECIAICNNQAEAEEYVSRHGQLAEWRRRRNNGEDIGWDETLPPRVERAEQAA